MLTNKEKATLPSREKKKRSRTRRALIGMLGWAVLLLGAVMIPYPGPGWVVVFVGLSILAKEFDWAQDVHDYAHDKYSLWRTWLGRQSLYMKMLFWMLTAMTVVVTIWLLNGYGIMNAWLDLGQNWLDSPFIK